MPPQPETKRKHWVRPKEMETLDRRGVSASLCRGDDLDASLTWIKKNFSSGKVNFETLEDLKQWAEGNEKKSITTRRHGAHRNRDA